MNNKSKLARSVMKGLSWRAFAAFDTMVVTSAVMFYRTGRFDMHAMMSMVLGIVGMELVTKTTLFAMHERMWERRAVKAVADVGETIKHDWQSLVATMDREFKSNRNGDATQE